MAYSFYKMDILSWLILCVEASWESFLDDSLAKLNKLSLFSLELTLIEKNCIFFWECSFCKKSLDTYYWLRDSLSEWSESVNFKERLGLSFLSFCSAENTFLPVPWSHQILWPLDHRSYIFNFGHFRSPLFSSQGDPGGVVIFTYLDGWKTV